MNYSKQRDAIIKYLRNVKNHPTAETIYNDLRVNNPELSLGTVYRNLDKLSKSGEILRLKQLGEKYRFDGHIKHHYHGQCIKCGKIIDIHLDYFNDIDSKIEDITEYDVVSHEIKFNLICPDCK